MKNIITISALCAAALLVNVGCKASASVHGTDARKLDNTAQVAYVSAPVQTTQASK